MPKTARIIGATALVGGVTAGAALLWPRLQRIQRQAQTIQDVQATFSPPGPYREAVHLVTATLTWVNPTDQPITYGVQGATIQAPPLGLSDLVGGRWWVSMEALGHASAGRIQEQDPFYRTQRVGEVTVGPRQTGGAQLVARPMIVRGEEWVFWVAPKPPADRLLANDAIGAHKSNLPPPQAQVMVQVI